MAKNAVQKTSISKEDALIAHLLNAFQCQSSINNLKRNILESIKTTPQLCVAQTRKK